MTYRRDGQYLTVEDSGRVLAELQVTRIQGSLWAHSLWSDGNGRALLMLLRNAVKEQFGEPVHTNVDPTNPQFEKICRLHLKMGWQLSTVVMTFKGDTYGH